MIDLTALGRSLALESPGQTLELDMSSAIYIGPDFDRIVYNGTPALRMTFACSQLHPRTNSRLRPPRRRSRGPRTAGTPGTERSRRPRISLYWFNPSAPGGGDQQCAAVGSGVNKAGMAELSLGTAAVMVAQLDEAPDMVENLTSGVSFGAHAIPHRWDMEGTAHAAGVVLRWWRDTYGQPEVGAAKALDLNPYDIITLEAAEAPIGCHGLLFFPFFNSQANPHFHDNARGGMLGITQIHTRKACRSCRSRVSSTSCAWRWRPWKVHSAARSTQSACRAGVRSPCSGARCRPILASRVERLKVSECAVLGAAILGAVGAGALPDLDEAIENMVHTHGFIEPNMANPRSTPSTSTCSRRRSSHS